ncbi:MAG: response regulator [Bacteroidales bacterium]|nr:response regulator [Bacteroidales bacterium]
MKKILAIDDEKTIQLIIKTALKGKYDVELKNDGQDAFYWLTKGKNMPDLIICDIEMPNMSGYEFLENIRNSGFFGDIPVIMLSGVEESKERIRCYDLKAQDFLTKPFNPQELLSLIEKNLNPKIRLRNIDLRENEKLYYYKLGALDFLPEPFDIAEAEQKIKEKIAGYKEFQ